MANKGRIDPTTPSKENPEWTDEMFAAARPTADVLAELGIPIPRPRGRPVADNPKMPVSIRLDPEVVTFFKASGSGWQTRLNDVLVNHIKEQAKKRA
jgi:uncharacterized protein (DUF4415 family)